MHETKTGGRFPGLAPAGPTSLSPLFYGDQCRKAGLDDQSAERIVGVILSALSVFASLMLATRGRPSQWDVETFLAAGYTERHILEIILAILVKTLSNYTNHLFHTPVDSVFARRAWAA